MKDTVVDSSVVAKWILPETDSNQAQDLLMEAAAAGCQLIVLDLAYCEVANAIWKRARQQLITASESANLLDSLIRVPVRVEPAMRWLPTALEIAGKYDRAVYDALFVALTRGLGLQGVTADEALFNASKVDFPEIRLLRNWGSAK